MRQLKPVFFVFVLLVFSAVLVAADTAAPQTVPMTPEFLAMIGAAAPAAGNCDTQASPAVAVGIPQPKPMACDPWVPTCTLGGECPACGFHCVRVCSSGCCDCSCW